MAKTKEKLLYTKFGIIDQVDKQTKIVNVIFIYPVKLNRSISTTGFAIFHIFF